MKCLYCGKEIRESASVEERTSSWHINCVKKFFGTNKMPAIDIDDGSLLEIAKQSINKGFTVTGVQKKLSLHLSKEDRPRLTLINYPSGYILKPQTEEYKSLPELEFLVMKMAEKIGIKVVPFALIKMKDGSLAYITKRIDRVFENENIKMLAMEDFCQIDERLTADKYKGSYERCAKIITNYSNRTVNDLVELFFRLIFSFIVGNSDMHLKNFSLIEDVNNFGEYYFAPAYDMLPVNLVLPEDTEQMALTLNGKKNKIEIKDFIIYAEKIGIPTLTANKIITKLINSKSTFIEMINNMDINQELKDGFIELLDSRYKQLNHIL